MEQGNMALTVLDSTLSVCKFKELSENLTDGTFCCVVRTEDELSVVCPSDGVPAGAIAQEDGWRALKVLGPLDFGLVGILAKIASALADAEVPLFAISTYDTDYILVKEQFLEMAIAALRASGFDVAR